MCNYKLAWGLSWVFHYLPKEKKIHIFVMFADICEFNNISPLLR